MTAPTSVALSPQALALAWDDAGARLPAALLRAQCRCAECLSARLRGTPVPVDPDTLLADARPVGHYAVQLVFSDGHERGIYPWALLRALADAGGVAPDQRS